MAMAMEADNTTALNFSVARIILKRYKANITKVVTKVANRACNGTPGNFNWKITEMPPKKAPSNKAYGMANMRAVFGLKVATKAKIKPPMAPTMAPA